ncbi:MAG: hypothetical protein LBR11_12305 [Deltaproteobacteria bacterium]|jgi:hypothetical protein|nr:hypothetical protein [Deltaproteobacteria bacterium]
MNPEAQDFLAACGLHFSLDQLRSAFESVANKADWKGPIDALVQADQVKMVAEAIDFFAGCRPTYAPAANGQVRVRAVGYYEAVGA